MATPTPRINNPMTRTDDLISAALEDLQRAEMEGITFTNARGKMRFDDAKSALGALIRIANRQGAK